MLVGLISYKVLKIVKTNNIETYKEFVNFIINKNLNIKTNKKYLNLSFIINTIVNIFLLTTFYIMIAGFGAFFSQELGLNHYIGSGILAILCFISLIHNSNGVIKINTFLVPVLIVFIVAIGLINIGNIDIKTAIQNNLKINTGSWIISSILYASYNSILLIPVLITLKKHINNNFQITVATCFSGVIIFILAIGIYFLLTRVDVSMSTLEMPVVYIISKFFSKLKTTYAFIILASIYTTAISFSMSLLENITKNKKTYTHISLIMCITGFLISGFGFSNLINLLYPVFGYLGLVQIAMIFKRKYN